MKRVRIMTAFLLAAASSFTAHGVTADDRVVQEVKELERSEDAAVLASDLATLEKLWADDLTVNAPSDQVKRGKKEIFALIRAGMLDYASVERNVEAVLAHGDTVVTMGLEIVKPKGKTPFAGQVVHRRYTNVWMKRNGRWQLSARQASIICQN
jgi:ketosteroid isomerase-like protein